MLVATAREIAASWVASHAGRFAGAYLTGSVARLPDDAELPRTSDVDLVVVTAGTQASPKLGKFRYRGALLEVTYQAESELASAEHVLASYHLAGAFRTDTIIDDPTGRLRRLQVAVAGAFADPIWVRRRMLDVRRRIETGLSFVNPRVPFHEQVNAWLFPTGVTAHLPLVAALRNPTIRLRYPAVRAVVPPAVYADLLRLLGAARLTPAAVQGHLDALAVTFDATAAVARTPLVFSSDITPDARPIAIDGSQALVDAGDHREAMFWIVATYARCHTMLTVDAPELHRQRYPAFLAAAGDLGIADSADIRRRADAVLAYLPELWSVAERIGAGAAASGGAAR
jgi:hypothetical protein